MKVRNIFVTENIISFENANVLFSVKNQFLMLPDFIYGHQVKFNACAKILFVCLCWGFTAKSTH